MKWCKSFITTLALGALAAVTAFSATADEMSKPKGTMGSGTSNGHHAKSNQFWWPDQLDLSPLRDHDKRSSPLGEDFDYARAFNSLDLAEVKQDIDAVLTESQAWWPADFGNYGPFFIRMTWHSAGTYRTLDGRGGGDGGQQRFDPLNSWPDNGNLDKARRLLWPVKQKYGHNLSWADLIILAGNVALENMGFETYGFAAGRTDDWEPDLVYWGPELEMLASDRVERDGQLQRPLGATHMGLIYVNPEGPKGQPDPVGSAKNIRVAFGRMAMNDEETVALVAGGHTFGKMHGAHKASDCLGSDPAGSAVEEQGFGWKNKCGKGHSEDTVTSGLEGAWTQAPTRWTTLYLQNLLKFDPEYKKIAERFLANPDEFQKAFAKAWYKLTHRDMGPAALSLGPEVPSDELIWQDPIPQSKARALNSRAIKRLKKTILDSDLSVSELVGTAWASASSYRASDKRGGANGARIALAPQKDWPANNPQQLAKVLSKLKEIRSDYGVNRITLADLIVLGGAAGIEKAAKDAGINVMVPFEDGRGDTTQDKTDVNSFALLEPSADAFRNYFNASEAYQSPAEMLVDKADQLNLTVPEMTVLVGGMRVLGTNTDGSKHGVFTDNPGTLSNDFFVNLLDMSTHWKKADTEGLYVGVDRATGQVKYSATPVDLIFGSNTELRAVAETYAYNDSHQNFADDFVKAWTKVMRNDRFDLK